MHSVKKALEKKSSMVVAGAGLLLSAYGNLCPEKNLLGVSMQFNPRCLFYITNFTLLLVSINFIFRIAIELHAAYRDKTRIEKTKIERMLTYVHRRLLPLVLSAETFIAVFFWIAYLLNPAWVFSRAQQDKICLFLNMCMHGFPVLFLFGDYLSISSIRTKNEERDTNVCFVVYSVVCALIMVLYKSMTDRWRYGFLNAYGYSALGAFCVLMLISLYGIYQGMKILKQNILQSRPGVRSKINLQRKYMWLVCAFVALCFLKQSYNTGYLPLKIEGVRFASVSF